MMIEIHLENMEFFAYHGCIKEEQIIGNKFTVDLSYKFDGLDAAISDDINKTIDYQEIYNLVAEVIKTNSKLIENLAYRISQKVHQAFPNIKEIKVKVSKINPPLSGKIHSVSATIQQTFK